MKKGILKSIIFIIAISVLFNIGSFYKNNPSIYNAPVDKLRDEDKNDDNRDEDGIISYDKYHIRLKNFDGYDAKMITNFEEKLSTLAAKKGNSCDAITNAGFFNTDRSPIGLIAIDGKTRSFYESNEIFNAFVCYRGADNWSINMNDKEQPLCKFIFQTGPLLVYQFENQDLSSNNSVGRRTVFILDENDSPYILMVYDSSDYFSGPDFSTILSILSYLEGNKGIKIKSAINFDGGTASSYIDSSFEINELIPPGAFLCFNDIN